MTVDHLEKARLEIEGKGKRFRLLVITNPDNPTGGLYSPDRLKAFADWCVDHKIHMAVNEIYGLSIIDTQHPQLRQDYTTDAASRKALTENYAAAVSRLRALKVPYAPARGSLFGLTCLSF